MKNHNGIAVHNPVCYNDSTGNKRHTGGTSMSHLDAKMHAVHAASRLFADAPYQNFRNDAAGRQHDNPAAPLYEPRPPGQREYA